MTPASPRALVSAAAVAPRALGAVTDRMRRVPALAGALLALALGLLVLGLAAGSEGWSFAWAAESDLVWAIRAPRSVGALLTGALLGLAGALAQGLFRNPLADPYLLGSAAGAGLGVVLVLAAGGLVGEFIGLATADLLLRTGLVGAAFAGALGGVALTLVLARGTSRPLVLLLAGVVVGVLLSAVTELVRPKSTLEVCASSLCSRPAPSRSSRRPTVSVPPEERTTSTPFAGTITRKTSTSPA